MVHYLLQYISNRNNSIMKFITKIVLFLICTLHISCQKEQQKEQQKETTKITAKAEIQTKIVQSDSIQTPKKVAADKIIGKYYVTSFYNYLKNGFVLKNEEPKNEYSYYSFDFKKDGTITFKDLTKVYGCGNGVLHIYKANWKVKDNGMYSISIKGEYALESRFYTESEYVFKKLKNGDIYMKLHKVITNKKHQNWDEEF